MITGEHPFRGTGGDAPQVMFRIVTENPLRMDSLVSGVPPQVVEAVMRGLAKDPTERFASAAEFAEVLREGSRPSAELDSALAAQFAHDFHDLELPATLGVPPLSVLDQAWREAAPVDPNAPEFPAVSTSSSGDVAPKRSPWPWLAAGLLVVVGGAVAVAALGRKEQGNSVIVYQSARGADAVDAAAQTANAPIDPVDDPVDSPEDAGEADVDATTAEASPSDSPPRTNRRASMRPSTESSATRALASKQGALRDCFQQHSVEVSGVPQLGIRFRVAESGEVAEAALEPAAIGQTALGRCVLEVARTTQFGPQERPVTIRIPLRVRRAP